VTSLQGPAKSAIHDDLVCWTLSRQVSHCRRTSSCGIGFNQYSKVEDGVVDELMASFEAVECSKIVTLRFIDALTPGGEQYDVASHYPGAGCEHLKQILEGRAEEVTASFPRAHTPSPIR